MQPKHDHIPREHEQMLTLLRNSPRQPVPLEELIGSGIPHPATVIYELELRGHAISKGYARRRPGRPRTMGFTLTGDGPAGGRPGRGPER
jgi:hypothetical protein